MRGRNLQRQLLGRAALESVEAIRSGEIGGPGVPFPRAGGVTGGLEGGSYFAHGLALVHPALHLAHDVDPALLAAGCLREVEVADVRSGEVVQDPAWAKTGSERCHASGESHSETLDYRAGEGPGEESAERSPRGADGRVDLALSSSSLERESISSILPRSCRRAPGGAKIPSQSDVLRARTTRPQTCCASRHVFLWSLHAAVWHLLAAGS